MLTYILYSYVSYYHSHHCISGISVGVVGEWCVEGVGGVVWVVHLYRCAYVYINKHATRVNSYLSLQGFLVVFSIFKGNFVKMAAILNFKIIDTNTYL